MCCACVCGGKKCPIRLFLSLSNNNKYMYIIYIHTQHNIMMMGRKEKSEPFLVAKKVGSSSSSSSLLSPWLEIRDPIPVGMKKKKEKNREELTSKPVERSQPKGTSIRRIVCASRGARCCCHTRSNRCAAREKRRGDSSAQTISFVILRSDLNYRCARTAHQTTRKGSVVAVTGKKKTFSPHPIPKLSGPVRRCRAIRWVKKTGPRRRLGHEFTSRSHTRNLCVLLLLLLCEAAQCCPRRPRFFFFLMAAR